MHKRLLDYLLDLLIVVVKVIVIINYAITQTCLKVLKLLVRRFDVRARVYLLERERLEDKAVVEKLVADAPHVLLEKRVLCCCVLEAVLE